jgi:hypothetical protein
LPEIKNADLKSKLIGIYELITGIFGVILLLFNILKVLENKDIMFTYFLGLALYSGVALAGYALYNDFKKAARYSIWAQAIQILGITYGSAQYLFTGSAFLVLIIKSGVHFQMQLSPIAYNIASDSYPLPLEIKIFLVPVFILVILLLKK